MIVRFKWKTPIEEKARGNIGGSSWLLLRILRAALYDILAALTFFGLLKVTLVMPGTLVRPSFAIDFRAFFSLRECTIAPPAGSPSPVSTSESELSEPSSSAVTVLVGSSSGSSSIRGFDMLSDMAGRGALASLTLTDKLQIVVCAAASADPQSNIGNLSLLHTG